MKVSIQWLIFIFLFLFIHPIVRGQEVFPMDGSTLNYRQIMFEVPQVAGAKEYVFYFQKCNQRAESCASLLKYHSKFRAARITDPFEFGGTYRWHYEAKQGRKSLFKSKEFIFYIGRNELLDSNVQKWEFTKQSKKFGKGILLVDGLKLALDMKGKPVLYMNYKVDHAVRDINLTPQGTFTLVDNRMGEIKEMQLNGEMIWIGPSKYGESDKRTDKFHHEFEKLSSGNYLAAGKRAVSDFDETAGLNGVPENLICETMVEFDKDRNEVWRFDLLPELKRQFHISPTAEVFNPSRLGHLNGMVVDETKQIIYASFKTFNTVMKIDKQSNNILYQYGLKKINFKDSLEDGLTFEQQHAPIFNNKGNLLILNNGNPKTGSGITELLVADSLNSEMEVVQSIYFKDLLAKDYYAAQMGSIQETSKNTYLVCMGSSPHFFEMDAKKKRVLWQIYTYQNTRWNEKAYQWKPLHSYRIHHYSSLYPYYSLVDLVRTPNKEKLEITNMGTEPDTYFIFESNESGEPGKQLAFYTLKEGRKATYTFKKFTKGKVYLIQSKRGNHLIFS